MKVNRILFRVDGSKTVGMGHIFRAVTLAKEIRKIEPNACIIFCVKENLFAEEYLRSNCFKTTVLDKFLKPDEELFKVIEIIKKNCLNKIIIDKFDIDEKYVTKLKEFQISVIQFFYTNQSRIIADIAINPNIGFIADKDKVANSNSLLLVGSEYVLVQENFRNQNLEVSSNVKSMFISFGGGDKNNITPKIIKLLDEYFNCNIEIKSPILNIVIGPEYSNINQIIKVITETNLKVKMIININDLSTIMKSSDLAISSVGGTVYELLLARVPIISVLQSKDQEEVATFLNKEKCIINLGYLVEIEQKKLFAALNRAFVFKERIKMLNAASKLIDGKGAERCAKIILNLKRDI